MFKYTKVIIFILSLSWVVPPKFVSAQDIALGKPYELSAVPNYPFTAPSSDKSSLTDGIYTNGGFWQSKTTVGWSYEQLVSISIDLGQIQPVGSVSFNTAGRSAAGVYFPKAIYIFLSRDGQNYSYAGNAADQDNGLPHSYQIKKFTLNNINQPARYLLIAVIPQGDNLFCDEIEATMGKDNGGTINHLFPKSNLNKVIDSLESNNYRRTSLMLRIKKIEADANVRTKTSIAPLSGIIYQGENYLEEPATLRKIQNNLDILRAKELKKKYNSSFIVEQVNPWAAIDPFKMPVSNEMNLQYSFLILKNDVQYGAFLITNASSLVQSYDFRIKTNNNNTSLKLFTVPFVPTIRYIRVPDPLIPLVKGVKIGPGISQLYIFRITGNSTGVNRSVITITSNNHSKDLLVSSKVIHLQVAQDDILNAVNWAYLDYPMIRDRKNEAAQDLYAHHINTIVVPTQYIPRPGQVDFSNMVNYLLTFKGVKNILLSVGYESPYWTDVDYKNVPFLSDGWKKDFSFWYSNMLSAISEAGIHANIYLYPYDEITGEDNMDKFVNLILWARKSVPGFKVYGTLASKSAVKKLTTYLDISQINGFDLLQYLPKNHNQIWIYETRDSSKLLSPYSYYRLMSWKAFLNDVSGIGFWDYSESSQIDSIDFSPGNIKIFNQNYGVIYDGVGGSIISSRRWEAFRLGIEDYSILKVFANEFGIEKAKSFARIVVSAQERPNEADNIRNEMLEAL